MYGLQAISTNNGWSISIVGITIVYTGLVFLSFSISQLHKILDLWEDRENVKIRVKKMFLPKPKPYVIVTPSPLIYNVEEAVSQLYLLTTKAIGGEPFALPKLLDLAKKRGLCRPYSIVNELIKEGLIVPNGEGLFQWSSKCYDNILKEE